MFYFICRGGFECTEVFLNTGCPVNDFAIIQLVSADAVTSRVEVRTYETDPAPFGRRLLCSEEYLFRIRFPVHGSHFSADRSVLWAFTVANHHGVIMYRLSTACADGAVITF
jgi:hypothetical protein